MAWVTSRGIFHPPQSISEGSRLGTRGRILRTALGARTLPLFNQRSMLCCGEAG